MKHNLDIQKDHTWTNIKINRDMTPKFDILFSALLESPDIDNLYHASSDDDDKFNREEYDATIEYSPITVFRGLDVYEEHRMSGLTSYIFTDPDAELYIARVTLDAKTNEINTIWRHKNAATKGLMKDIFLYFLLDGKYPYLESSRRQSKNGAKMWQALIPLAISNGYKCSSIDHEDKSEYVFSSVDDFTSDMDILWPDNTFSVRIYAKS